MKNSKRFALLIAGLFLLAAVQARAAISASNFGAITLECGSDSPSQPLDCSTGNAGITFSGYYAGACLAAFTPSTHVFETCTKTSCTVLPFTATVQVTLANCEITKDEPAAPFAANMNKPFVVSFTPYDTTVPPGTEPLIYYSTVLDDGNQQICSGGSDCAGAGWPSQLQDLQFGVTKGKGWDTLIVNQNVSF